MNNELNLGDCIICNRDVVVPDGHSGTTICNSCLHLINKGSHLISDIDGNETPDIGKLRDWITQEREHPFNFGYTFPGEPPKC